MPDTNEPDFLDEIITESEAQTPGFTAKVEDALHRRVRGRAPVAVDSPLRSDPKNGKMRK